MIYNYSNFKIHQIQGFIQSMYLVEYSDKLLLLDSGTRLDGPVVKLYIEEEMGRSFTDLKTVVVTHAHPDHSGGAKFFKQRGVRVLAPFGINDWYRGFGGFFTYSIDILLTFMVRGRRNSFIKTYRNIFFPRSLNYSQYLQDDDLIENFPDWKVLSCPGHTATDITVYCPKEHVGYVADNVIYTSVGFIAPYPVSFPQKYKNSIEKTFALGLKDYLLAHYGKRELTQEDCQKFLKSLPKSERTHRNSLLRIFLRLFNFRRK